MGWLGWSEQQTLDTALPALERAMKGRQDMVLAMQGIMPEPKQKPPPSSADIMAAFRTAATGGDPARQR